MEYVIIGACIVVAIAGGIVLYVKNKRTKNELGNTAVVVSKTSSSKLQASEVANDPVIQIGILPADAISDETKLVEITDSKVLAHINNLVPGLAQAGNAANNATQAVKANGEVLYRAIIPAGAKLTDSKAMEGAVRGFYHGADGIRGHANLVAVEAQKGTAVAAMGVARYKEITRGGGGGASGDVPYEIDVHITEYDTGKIDANYMNSNFDKYVKLIQGDSDPGVVDAALKELHRSFSMLSQEEQRYAERFIHAVESGQAKLVPGKTFRDYITDYMKADEHARINRVVRRLGCYYALLKELLDRHATPSNIDDRGTFTELKKSVNKTKAENFFRLVFKDDYVPLRLPIYSENYLRDFIFSGGKDPYLNVIEVEQTSAYTPDDAREYNKPKVVVVKLTDNDYVGREIRTSVSYKTLENWYSESNAVKSVIESECFAYVEDKLCVATSECLERTDDGKIRLTEYAKTHEEECFLQFIVDEKDGTLHYVKLPKSKADEAFNYNDAITEDLLSQYGLVNEMSKEMLNAIDGEEFGPALDILMDKHICNYTARLLRSITGLDNRTISNMKKGENLTKSNVISACLGIHIPFRVSNHMLSLADLTLNMTSKGQVGDDNETYDMLLHLKWTTDYDDIYEELKVQSKDYLIHQPPVKK